jgi:hypothetical protein
MKVIFKLEDDSSNSLKFLASPFLPSKIPWVRSYRGQTVPNAPATNSFSRSVSFGFLSPPPAKGESNILHFVCIFSCHKSLKRMIETQALRAV